MVHVQVRYQLLGSRISTWELSTLMKSTAAIRGLQKLNIVTELKSFLDLYIVLI